MANLQSIALASVAALSLSHAAVAADLTLARPIPPPMAPIAMPVEEDGWYIRGDAGAGYNNAVSQSYAFPVATAHSFIWDKPGLSWGYLAGLGVGYQFNSWMRADVTVDYRGSIKFYGFDYATPKPGTGLLPGTNTYNGSLSSLVALFNLYADLGTWNGVTPYIGAGVGVAHNMFGYTTDTGGGSFTGGAGYMKANGKTNFAWALMAGASYDLTQRLKLDVSYRYINMGDYVSGQLICNRASIVCGGRHTLAKADAHDIRIGFRYMFGGPTTIPQASIAMPVVARY